MVLLNYLYNNLKLLASVIYFQTKFVIGVSLTLCGPSSVIDRDKFQIKIFAVTWEELITHSYI